MSSPEKVLFINPTLKCNINCPRCFLSKYHRSRKDIIKDEHLIDIMSHPFFSNHDKVTAIIEGGEPVVLGKDYIYHLINLIRNYLPQAHIRMVTNLFSVPEWLVDISKDYFDNELETTFALGKKETLKGSEEDYLNRFTKNLKYIVDQGINIHVNIETNKETIEKGPKAIIDIAKETGCKSWEFDVSVDFSRFRDDEQYTENGYPLLPTTTTYKELSDYIKEFFTTYRDEILSEGIKSSIFSKAEIVREKSFFNVMRNNEFITVNPTGTVTTTPLFSDSESSFIGNLNEASFDDCLRSMSRRGMTRDEIHRTQECQGCRYFNQCQGGSSHIPVFDGSGECAGLKEIWKLRESNPIYNEVIN